MEYGEFEPVDFEARALTCVRGGRTVFTNLSLKLEAGHALALRGANGSGKSSLLRLLAGLGQPAEGQILVGGTPATDDPEGYRTLIHYVGHAPAVKSALTVRQNVAFWSELYDADDYLDAALARFSLTSLATLPARYLSDGQRRRTALARIAAVPLPVWLLDEPTTGLDDASVGALGDLMSDHLEAGGIIIAATHGPLPIDAQQTLVINGGAS